LESLIGKDRYRDELLSFRKWYVEFNLEAGITVNEEDVETNDNDSNKENSSTINAKLNSTEVFGSVGQQVPNISTKSKTPILAPHVNEISNDAVQENSSRIYPKFTSTKVFGNFEQQVLNTSSNRVFEDISSYVVTKDHGEVTLAVGDYISYFTYVIFFVLYF
jgi:hypothetical protein